jgi:hypothetical protein
MSWVKSYQLSAISKSTISNRYQAHPDTEKPLGAIPGVSLFGSADSRCLIADGSTL